jgi:hypothetical protein
MFETLSDRIAGTFLMGLDVAVEFATLGEFRLVEAEALLAPTSSSTDAGSPMRRPARLAGMELDRSLLPKPSTALARQVVADREPPVLVRPAPVAPGCRRRMRGGAQEAPTRTPPRVRAGSVPPAAQLCLLPQ